jgi:hypothetical protein
MRQRMFVRRLDTTRRAATIAVVQQPRMDGAAIQVVGTEEGSL